MFQSSYEVQNRTAHETVWGLSFFGCVLIYVFSFCSSERYAFHFHVGLLGFWIVAAMNTTLFFLHLLNLLTS